MTQTKLDLLVADARAEKQESGGRIVAMWAGMEAVKLGVTDPCPFREDEAHLVKGYEAGVQMQLRRRDQPPEEPPVFDVTPFHLRAFGHGAVGSSFAARSMPKEEE